jgi:aldehyde dehydrogenase (NAD+)
VLQHSPLYFWFPPAAAHYVTPGYVDSWRYQAFSELASVYRQISWGERRHRKVHAMNQIPGRPSSGTSPQQVFDELQAHRWQVAGTSAGQRVLKLQRLKDAIIRHRRMLADAVHADFGKHRAETELSEIQPLLLELNEALRHLPRWIRPSRVRTPWVLAGTQAEIRREPKGVVLILAPWNYPVNLALAPLVAAVAAGNCVLLKPSEKAPRTAQAISLVIAAAFEAHEVACLLGGADLAEALLSLPFDHIFFTGSSRIGRLVMRAAADHLAGVTLELGGKSPAIVDGGAAMATAAERVVWGKFINAGQTCIAPDYVLVQESAAGAFVEQAARSVRRFHRSPADGSGGDLCRIIDEAAWDRLTATLHATLRGGARLAVGGDSSRADRYLSPTILTHVSGDMPIMQEEIFGPILPVLTYRTLDEAAAFVRSRPKPLALYVFSGRRQVFDHVLHRTTAGGTVWNNVLLHFGNPNLPFGGVGASGLGNYHGWFGFRTFSHERAVMRQGRFSMMSPFYPPYGSRTVRRLKWLSRLIG